MTDAPARQGVWDDKAISKSWDQVVSDYKIFHNVRARGGSVADLPPNLLAETAMATEPAAAAEAETAEAELPLKTDEQESKLHANAKQGTNNQSKEQPENGVPETPTPFAAEGTTSAGASLLAPQSVMGGVADENLKKLLMSWYYAGYYTGLYEGQQQAQKTQRQPQPDEQQDHEV